MKSDIRSEYAKNNSDGFTTRETDTVVYAEPHVVPHPPVYRVKGYDTNEMEAHEYRNG